MVVCHDKFIVHPRIHLLETPHKIRGHTSLPLPLRVEQPQLDVGMPVNGHQSLVATNQQEVIDQQANAYASVGCPEDALQQQEPTVIAVPEVVQEVQG